MSRNPFDDLIANPERLAEAKKKAASSSLLSNPFAMPQVREEEHIWAQFAGQISRVF